MPKPADAVTVVIPVHNSAQRLEAIVPAWGVALEKTGRPFEILIVDDGSTDTTAEIAAKLTTRVRHTRLLKQESQKGYGASLRTALAETKTPLFFYTAVDYPYAPADIGKLLERIDLRDEILHKQPDLISGCRTGLPTPKTVFWIGGAWKLFWRVFAGLPISESLPWHGWGEFWYATRVHWLYAIPLIDVNSCFKLFRTEFLKRFPIQSDGDFVHTELVAKATFLTSIMDEVPLTPKPDPLPSLGPLGVDQRRVFRRPEFAFPPPPPPPGVPAPPPPAPPIPARPETKPTSTESPKLETASRAVPPLSQAEAAQPTAASPILQPGPTSSAVESSKATAPNTTVTTPTEPPKTEAPGASVLSHPPAEVAQPSSTSPTPARLETKPTLSESPKLESASGPVPPPVATTQPTAVSPPTAPSGPTQPATETSEADTTKVAATAPAGSPKQTPTEPAKTNASTPESPAANGSVPSP
jgi:hypothetical protein